MHTQTKYVHYSGKRSLDAALNWGQQEVWDLIEKEIPEEYIYNILGSFQISAAEHLDETQCLRALSFFLSRHESLRTVYPKNGNGQVFQRVLSEGQIPVEVVSTSLPELEGTISVLRGSFATWRFNLQTEPPVRVALVIAEGRVSGVVYVLSHMATDWHGMQQLSEEVVSYFKNGEDISTLAEYLFTPVDLALWQMSPEGAAKRDNTLRHVESLFESRVPLGLPPRLPEAPDSTELRRASLWSRASREAVNRTAHAAGVSTSAVILGTAVSSLRDCTGSNIIDLYLTSSQRFTKRVRSMVATLMQDTYFSVDLTGADVGESIKRSWVAALTAYQNSGCDYSSMHQLMDRLGKIHNQPIRINYMINDKRSDATPGPVDRDRDIEALLGESVLSWIPSAESWSFYLDIEDDGDALVLSLTCDIRYFSPKYIEDFLLDLEIALIEHAKKY
ncbi:condensation domain-containing protein [Streptomyces sp. NPDC048282]|uniref:condensation domain-containing protein n=1 Tax=Streptomyces sp. NPDC048282 TaxID=3365528 RepID=UPI00370FECCD